MGEIEDSTASRAYPGILSLTCRVVKRADLEVPRGVKPIQSGYQVAKQATQKTLRRWGRYLRRAAKQRAKPPLQRRHFAIKNRKSKQPNSRFSESFTQAVAPSITFGDDLWPRHFLHAKLAAMMLIDSKRHVPRPRGSRELSSSRWIPFAADFGRGNHPAWLDFVHFINTLHNPRGDGT